MTKQEAINLLTQVCADYVGTLKDHQKIQLALTIITQIIESKEPALIEQKIESETKPSENTDQ